MFERKLVSLDYHSPNNFDYQDEKTFRNFVSWLENQKIRFYKIEDRANLDKVEDDNWPKALENYLNDLELNDVTIESDREEIIEELLSHAIQFEYSDNIEKINTFNANQDEFIRGNSGSNPLENIDYNSAEFKEGMNRVQTLLNVPSKQDDVTTVLQAISKLISDKLNPSAVQAAIEEKNKSVKPTESDSVKLSLESINTGFDTEDKILNEAIKVLRLLHIKELRDLQTKINETIVNIQVITANPKTDSSLGRVGK